MIIRRELEPLLANVVEAGDMIFTAGCIADDESLDVGGQTRQALGDLDRWLAMCGSDRSHILQVVIWLSDIRFRDAMNAVWLEWVDPANLPARACIEARMATPGCLVEIMAIAVKPAAGGKQKAGS
ncbi:RidA family protein [Hyphomicrobium sp. CS1BSMeth3]|uniref:RidA family protein n=1 Tax=Hyphomicrobium sp. CS1BSMeth3 TaxID=1892844 RepID=UPI000930B437|nr:RidA family protein [Hyphomicrobium sp. CS1BSMeth3]